MTISTKQSTTSTTTANFTTTEQTKANTFGDVNYDGKIDSKDATRILVYYAKTLVGQMVEL